ncbi:50S ribosomal protein L29 [Myxococcota bacterium]|nr:50S ribosomal protein L29 [Myxococcota bacterium]
MALGELRALSDRDLLVKERDIVQDMVLARFQHHTGQLEKTADLNKLRRDLARVKTLVRQREVERGLAPGALAASVGSLREEGPALSKVQERFGRKE